MPVREQLVNDVHSKLMGLLQRAPYIRCEDVHRQYAVNWLMNNGVTVQKWIPRNEPPKKNGRYLCRYVFNEHYDMPFEQVLSYYATDKEPHFSHEGVEHGMKVTHWMPLPEPPKEVNNG